MAARAPGEVCFVDLAPPGGGAQVPQAVLGALGLREAGLLPLAPGPPDPTGLLDRLVRDGLVVFHDLAVPGSPANVDHLVLGPQGCS